MLRFSIVISFLILLFVSLRKRRMDIVSRRFLLTFLVIWSIALIGSFYSFFYLKPVSTYAYVLLCINVLSFYIGFSLIKYNQESESLYNNAITGIKFLANNTLFKVILAILCIYIYSLLVIFASKIIALQSLGALRSEFYDEHFYGPTYEILNPYVITPFSFIAMPVFSYLLLNDRKNITFYLSAFFIIGSMSLSGGRFGYYRLFMAIFFMIYVVNTSFKFKRKTIFTFVLITFAFFSVITYITSARKGFLEFGSNSNARSEMVDAVTIYVTGPIAAFDYALTNDDVKLVGGYKYGRLTLSPVEQLIENVLRRIGVHYQPALDDVVEIKQNRLIYYDDFGYNALYTAAYIFYLDFGIMGVILIPFLIGLLFRKVIILCYKTNSYWHFVLLLWCFIRLSNSIFDYGFYSKTDFIFIIILLYIGNRYMKYSTDNI